MKVYAMMYLNYVWKLITIESMLCGSGKEIRIIFEIRC